MTGNNKIEEAKEKILEKHFRNQNEDFVCIDHIKEPVYLDYQIKQAIELGAQWAINQYLEDLLHPVSEIPHSKDGYCCVYMFRKNKDISNVLYIEKENIWDELVNGYQGIAWCYINELFPKKKLFDLIKKRGKQ